MMFLWQWHGRQAFTEIRNDLDFPRISHRVVYHLDDSCEAANEDAARATFRRFYPDAQELGIYLIGPVNDDAREPVSPKQLEFGL